MQASKGQSDHLALGQTIYRRVCGAPAQKQESWNKQQSIEGDQSQKTPSLPPAPSKVWQKKLHSHPPAPADDGLRGGALDPVLANQLHQRGDLRSDSTRRVRSKNRSDPRAWSDRARMRQAGWDQMPRRGLGRTGSKQRKSSQCRRFELDSPNKRQHGFEHTRFVLWLPLGVVPVDEMLIELEKVEKTLMNWHTHQEESRSCRNAPKC